MTRSSGGFLLRRRIEMRAVTLNDFRIDGDAAARPSIRAARAGFAAGHAAIALRHLDRAWRTSSSPNAALARLYARLLIDAGEATAALQLLRRAAEVAPSPAVEVLAINAMIKAGDTAGAVVRAEAALRRYA